MKLPFVARGSAAVSAVGVQPLLRIGVPQGKTLHLKYIKYDFSSTNLFTVSVYINGILNTVFDWPPYACDFPYNVILPEFTQLRLDINTTTGAATIFNVALVGDIS